jgi:hypothetical protein
MKFSKKLLAKLSAGIILGGVAGAGLSYFYGLLGAT